MDFVAVIIKPSLLGDIERTRQWILAARQHRLRPIISAAFESEVGLSPLPQWVLHIVLMMLWDSIQLHGSKGGY